MALALAALLLSLVLWQVNLPESGRGKAIVRIAVSPSGLWIAAACAAGRIVVWPLKGSAAPRQFQNRAGTVNDLSFSSDDRWLAAADRCLTLHELDGRSDSRVLRDDHRNYGTVQFSSDGSQILTINGSGVIELLAAATGNPTARFCCSTVAGAVAFGPGDTQIVSAGHLPRVLDARSLTLLRRLTPDRQFMTLGPVAFRGFDLLMGSQDGRIHIWDWRTYAPKQPSPASMDWVDTIAVHGGTGVVASSGFGKPLRLWNPDTRSVSVLAHIRPTSNVAFIPATSQLAVGLAGGTVTIWDITQAKRTAVFRFPPRGE